MLAGLWKLRLRLRRGDMMEPNLKLETEKLSRSWLRHDAGWLNDYLVAGVEDPRLNLQSVFSRHFLIYALAGNQFEPLMEQEYRFAAAQNWFLELGSVVAEAEEMQALLHALRVGADNAEGLEIPRWVVKLFGALPAEACGVQVPNYLERLLTHSRFESGKILPDADALNLFAGLWQDALRKMGGEIASGLTCGNDSSRRPLQGMMTVLEPACGSANEAWPPQNDGVNQGGARNPLL